MSIFSSSSSSSRGAAAVMCLSTLVGRVAAHGGHLEKIPEGKYISDDPIDTTLWLHILLMILSFGIIFPAGMVLGMTRNRWHVPVQILGALIAVPAYFMGHMHQGRAFAHNVHAQFAHVLVLQLAAQAVCGIYLKVHITRGVHGTIRKVAVVGHGVLGKAMPVVAWVQMLLGGITALGYCREDHRGQCLAHLIMGSALIGYGILLTLLMLVGQAWLRRTGRSQEFFDSALIAAWGCVNTFTEHRWGGPWVGNDVQHTTMGVIWWCAGLTGVWLSRKRDGSPQRNVIPGCVIFITGWAMSAHPQHLPLSTMVHTAFGYTLMAAGAARIVEIAFVLQDASTISEHGEAHSWQYMAPFLLCASGFLFMGATEEQMELVSDAGISHVSYVLVLYSFAFLLFLFANILLNVYAAGSSPPVPPKDLETSPPAPPQRRGVNGTARADGSVRANGRVNGGAARTVRDAEEFELEGLMSDDEEQQLESPSTLGKNSPGRVE